jgi:predicted DNA-binding transcriptional regulator YafY
LSCRYEALSTGELTARVVEPGELYWDPSLESMYLIGWCRLRQAVRVFAVHRFRMVSAMQERFAPRAECTSRAALSDAFHVWREGNVARVVVRLRDWAARQARERKGHPSQETTRLPDGEVRVTLEVAGFEEVTRWVLGLGELAVVEEPAALRAHVAAALEAASRAYAGDTAPVDATTESAAAARRW